MRLIFGQSSSATCDDSDDPAFDNDSRWPRRLLHLPTWTSHPWRPGNVYGGQAEPKYVALSYTWGRWQLADGIKPEVGGLPIRGVPWTIPRVDPDLHFTIEQFTSVLHKILQDPQLQARHYAWRGTRIESQAISTFLRTIELRVPLHRYIWLDMACIDQRYNENTLAEIGRQARIFQHAEEVYVWLSRTLQTRLQSLLTDFGDAALKLEVEPYMKDQTAEQLLNTETLMGQVLRGLEGLHQDPWFTSLWTLQEAYLCPGAIILSSEGTPVTRRGRTLDVSRIESLELIFSHANSLSYWLTKTNYARSSPHFLQIMNLIRKTGLEALWRNNPMALLGVSHSRKASHELDHGNTLFFAPMCEPMNL
jgi:Heterokaryon incompatibility protein (HET)